MDISSLERSAARRQSLFWGVERANRVDPAGVLAAAAAHDLNDELTVILTSVTTSIRALEPGHPARPLLFDLESAALRCASKVSRLLDYAARRGTVKVRAGLENLLDDMTSPTCL
jgi:signal transduction histidine kinase